ncbi:MAG: phosphoribosylamine--glycine ligase [Candidatus Kapabacteria bacterium]|nr:phosphoribosylamine--glycine ligase [Candidatus Kapabacteria bacterium]
MKILIIGAGGREHALTLCLSNSPYEHEIYAAPGNPGIFKIANRADINTSDYDQILNYCKNECIDLVVIGPEQPLSEGLADILRAGSFNVFGPSRLAAQLESSKDFAKQFMQRHGIPTAAFRTFPSNQIDDAKDYINSGNIPVVLKADGLAAGKGVIVALSKEEAFNALEEMFGGCFGDAGSNVVIEEFMTGTEASILAICDGSDFVCLSSAQDHKRIADNDEGKNTGGMGAYSPAPIVSNEVLDKVKTQIISPVLRAMAAEGNPFNGCLYVGLMIEGGDPKVVEFNVRFGDPETQTILSIFKGDFAGLLYSAAKGRLDNSCISEISDLSSCCIILASGGYPDSFEKGFVIKGIEEAEKTGAIVFHAGTIEKDGLIQTSGGRVLGVTAVAANLKEAINAAYQGVNCISFEKMYYRRDIGFKGL